ncbi:hypothetical protein ID866_8625 [Astraeus odoratus]|nr:hypothetical protein ID866_8625 [Astraeus odoratus]
MASECVLGLVATLPVTLCGKAIGWLLDTYASIPDVQRKFMAYIVHLTHVLDILFTLTATRKQQVLTTDVVDASVDVYYTSQKWRCVHEKIGKFSPSLFGGQDVMSEIESLLWDRYISNVDLGTAVERTAVMLRTRTATTISPR